ncbi:MAG: hypothetical protein A3I76_07325 [Elusimicrobia bacterium RIFCSPLOWO2_02_FULL_61_11]|nr:MAG: hypothetical protein A3I76_07325 [Elusimicrobia bacterium RIFCSPLOWO2_02_FULL_61_11]
MLHEPAAQSGPDASADYKMRVGVWMFLLYAAVYAAFVAINLLRPLWMEKSIIFGLNLAVVYGFGLIGFALVLALIYNYMCGLHEAGSKAAEGGK